MEYAPTLRHVPESVLRRRHLGWTTPDHIHDSVYSQELACARYKDGIGIRSGIHLRCDGHNDKRENLSSLPGIDLH